MSKWKTPHILWRRWKRGETISEIANSLNMDKDKTKEIIKEYHEKHRGQSKLDYPPFEELNLNCGHGILRTECDECPQQEN